MVSCFIQGAGLIRPAPAPAPAPGCGTRPQVSARPHRFRVVLRAGPADTSQAVQKNGTSPSANGAANGTSNGTSNGIAKTTPRGPSSAALRDLAAQIEAETAALKEELTMEMRRRELAEVNLREVTKQFELARRVRDEMEEGQFGAMDEVIGQFRASLNSAQMRAAVAEKELEEARLIIKKTRREASSVGADRWQLAAVFSLFFLLLTNLYLKSDAADHLKTQIADYIMSSI